MEKMFLFGNIIDLFILYLYQLKNTLNILVALLKFFPRKSNTMPEEHIENITYIYIYIYIYVSLSLSLSLYIYIYIYIYYILNPWLRNGNTDFTLDNCLLGSVKPT